MKLYQRCVSLRIFVLYFKYDLISFIGLNFSIKPPPPKYRVYVLYYLKWPGWLKHVGKQILDVN